MHLLVTDKYETSGAHLHMLVNIPVTFYDSGSYPTHKNLGRKRSVGYIVNNSRAITLHLLGTDKYETSGAHFHMLVNIPVTFYDSGSYTF